MKTLKHIREENKMILERGENIASIPSKVGQWWKGRSALEKTSDVASHPVRNLTSAGTSYGLDKSQTRYDKGQIIASKATDTSMYKDVASAGLSATRDSNLIQRFVPGASTMSKILKTPIGQVGTRTLGVATAPLAIAAGHQDMEDRFSKWKKTGKAADYGQALLSGISAYAPAAGATIGGVTGAVGTFGTAALPGAAAGSSIGSLASLAATGANAGIDKIRSNMRKSEDISNRSHLGTSGEEKIKNNTPATSSVMSNSRNAGRVDTVSSQSNKMGSDQAARGGAVSGGPTFNQKPQSFLNKIGLREAELVNEGKRLAAAKLALKRFKKEGSISDVLQNFVIPSAIEVSMRGKPGPISYTLGGLGTYATGAALTHHYRKYKKILNKLEKKKMHVKESTCVGRRNQRFLG